MSTYKDTIFLPKTDFQMNVKSPTYEEEILKRWKAGDIYNKILKRLPKDNEFVLHDGPPFANGHPHAGTALNKVLKDIILRLNQKNGKYAAFVPGWDCHGLPIEWKIEENLKKEKKNKNDISVTEFRKLCMDFANYWIDVQKEDFQRLGSLGDWNNPYLTMDKKNEAVIAGAIGDFVLNDALYNADRPVHWSVIEETALADAEIEYHNKTSNSIYVKFAIKSTKSHDLNDAFIAIWTTTPWTLPGNRAISYNPEANYSLINIDNSKIIVATKLIDEFKQKIPHHSFSITREILVSEFENTICAHPFSHLGFDLDVVLLAGDHVTLDAGTGLVHTAPSHGIEDFNICKENGITMQCPVGTNGVYLDSVKYFAGKHIFKVEDEIIDILKSQNTLLQHEKFTHSYPHSWRSKSPLIFRTTPQWFINVNKIRKKALESIEKVNWIPAQGYNRIKAFTENRGDWCISRQRFWGVPLTLFVHKQTGALLKDKDVIKKISETFAQEGSDAWYTHDTKHFLCGKYNHEEYDKCTDVLDVWFESSVSHLYVLEQRENLRWPADLYLEGSDQHRGWFQHSLLAAVKCRNNAPFKSVLTHGFVVDEQGRKMSKSLGNTINLSEIIEKYGADIFRLWVVSSDYTQDLKIGPSIIKQQEEIYKKIRNILKYLLGASGEQNKHTKEDQNKQTQEDNQLTDQQIHPQSIEYQSLENLEKWILYKIYNIDKILKVEFQKYDLKKYFSTILNFCFNDLSAFLFDIRKDCLYCDDINNTKRAAYMKILNIIFHYLLRWLSSVLVYTTEQAWNKLYPNSSIHLQDSLTPPEEWNNESLDSWIATIKQLRKVTTGALEIDRQEKKIGSSLQAHVIINDPNNILKNETKEFLEDVFIVSKVTITNEPENTKYCEKNTCETNETNDDSKDDNMIKSITITTQIAQGHKCERCWKIVDKLNGDICERCFNVIN